MRRRTILHTIETGGPGGAETVLLNLASKLDKSRFRSLVLLSEDRWLHQKLLEKGAETILVESRVWYDLRLPRAIAGLARREKVDLIHSHLPDQNFYSCLAGRLAGCRTIATYHGPVELARAHEAKHAIKLWWVRRSASAIVVVCDYVGRMLQEIGFPAKKIVRIYNGIDVGRFNGAVPGRFRAELGLTDESKLVGMVANIRQSKGYEYFIRAARIVADRIPAARFVAIGDVDHTLGKPLFDLLHQLRLQDRFSFLGFRHDVPEILRDLDVFVLSSTGEGFPLATLEAMAAGRPTVVTRCGGPEEVIEDGSTGRLVPPADAEALAATICELLGNPGRAAALGRAARAKVVREFSVERMLGDYERLYEHTLNAS